MSTSDAKHYHHGDLRNALLAAAVDLLASGGVEAVTLREAARAAGVSHNAPYRHFASRDALLAALAAEGFARLRAKLEAENASGDCVVALGLAYLAFAAAQRPLFRLMFGGAVDKAAFPDLAQAGLAALAVLDRAVTGQAHPAGAVPSTTLRAWALVHGLAHLVADGQISPDAAAMVLTSNANTGDQ